MSARRRPPLRLCDPTLVHPATKRYANTWRGIQTAAPNERDAHGEWFLEQLDSRHRIRLEVARVGFGEGDVVIVSALARCEDWAFAPHVLITTLDIGPDEVANTRPWLIRMR
jgi:hypothetical protein